MELKHCTKEAIVLLFACEDISIGQCLKNLKKKSRLFYHNEPIWLTMQKYVVAAKQFAHAVNYMIGKHILDFDDYTMEPYIWSYYPTHNDIYLSLGNTWTWNCKSVGCKNVIDINDLFQRRDFVCLSCCLSNTNINSLISCMESLQQVSDHWYQLEAYLNPVVNFIRFSAGLRKKLLEPPKSQLTSMPEIQFRQLVLFNTRFQKHIAAFIDDWKR